MEARDQVDAAAEPPARPSGRAGRPDGLLTPDQLAAVAGPLPDELAALIDVHLPRPGDGDTWSRLEFLRDLGRADLSLARLMECHLDGTGILAEFGEEAPDGFGAVWAARPEELEIAPISGGWALWGTKPFCFGAPWCSWALVLGREPAGGVRLVLLRPADLAVFDPASWPAAGLARTFAYTARFVGVLDGDAALGPSGAYEQRAGRWHAAIGLAACGLGAAQALLDELDAGTARARGGEGRLGRALARLAAVDALMERAAQEIDHEPFDSHTARRRAVLVRAAVADAIGTARSAASELASPDQWSHDVGWVRRAADIDVFLGHHHANDDEVDLALERDA